MSSPLPVSGRSVPSLYHSPHPPKRSSTLPMFWLAYVFDVVLSKHCTAGVMIVVVDRDVLVVVVLERDVLVLDEAEVVVEVAVDAVLDVLVDALVVEADVVSAAATVVAPRPTPSLSAPTQASAQSRVVSAYMCVPVSVSSGPKTSVVSHSMPATPGSALSAAATDRHPDVAAPLCFR